MIMNSEIRERLIAEILQRTLDLENHMTQLAQLQAGIDFERKVLHDKVFGEHQQKRKEPLKFLHRNKAYILVSQKRGSARVVDLHVSDHVGIETAFGKGN